MSFLRVSLPSPSQITEGHAKHTTPQPWDKLEQAARLFVSVSCFVCVKCVMCVCHVCTYTSPLSDNPGGTRLAAHPKKTRQPPARRARRWPHSSSAWLS